MVLRTRILRGLTACAAAAALAVLLPALGEAADPADSSSPEAGRVTLPLADYLALVGRGEALERARAEEAAHRETPVAEVVAQRTAVRIDGGVAEITARFEALVQGHPKEPLLLPFDGLVLRGEVRPLAADGAERPAAALAAADGGHGLRLVAPAAGRYAVEVGGRAALADRDGVQSLALAPAAAPVAEVEVDLPADLAWSAPGAVTVEERVAGGRRTVRLATPRGTAQALEIHRHLAGTEAEKLLVQSVVLTLFQLRPEGFRRHDVVLYEVSRGGLASLAVDLPPGLDVEQAATDEGDVVPLVEARHLAVERKRQLRGIGYLVLTSTPRAGAALPALPVVPATEVRARYLAIASSVAARVEPAPAASWLRVDLGDLPPALGQALQTLDLLAAWRLQPAAATGAPEAADLALTVALLPPAPRLATLVRERDTTTLLTVDGTVLHRDRFVLDQAGASLDLALPAGAVLWSAKVGDQPVRPVERGGRLSVPLGFARAGAPPVIEVVAVAERTIPRGRSQLTLALPQVAAPVVEHRWTLLLPDGPQYRFRAGTLRPTAERAEEAAAGVGAVLSLAGGGAAGGAAIRGKVTIDNGGPAPGVTIELRSPARPQPWTVVTNAAGTFLIEGLPTGRYAVTARLEGFRTVEVPNVDLPSGKVANLAIVIRPEVLMETIMVTAETSPLYDRRAPSPDKELEAAAARDAFRRDAGELKQGLVGGVKPLPIAIPEAGKSFLLAGALPPAQVAVELEVRAKR